MHNLFIIVEGPDNVGKSTLIQNIKNSFKGTTFHALHYSNVKQPDAETVQAYSTKMYNEMFSLMLDMTKYPTSGVICDRSHIGEMVYGPIYRDYSGEYVLDIEKQFIDIPSIWNNLLLVTMIDEPENLVARDDGLSFTTNIAKKSVEIANFIEATNKSQIKHKLLINVKSNDAQQCIDAVGKYVNENILKD